MFLITHSLIAMASVTFVLALVYMYIFLKTRESYIGFWGFSWAVYSLSFIFDFLKFGGQNTYYFIAEKQIFYILSSLLLLYGAYNFLGQKAPNIWSYISFLSVFLIGSALFIQHSFLVITLHTSIFLCLISVWTGMLFLLQPWEIEEGEKKIVGFCFILWGIYKGYYPFVQPQFWLAPWSYLGGAILTDVISILILVIYFEKTKNCLLASETRFRLLTEHAQDMIYRYRFLPVQNFEYVSPASTKITGYTPEEFYANPDLFFEQIHPDDRFLLEIILKSPDSSGEPVALRWIRKDGKIIWTEQHYRILSSEGENGVILEGILRDITERKKVEEDLLRIEKSRRHLLTNISHELRTPITSIQGYLEAMLDGVVAEPLRQWKYLKIIHSRVLALNRLIQDLFQLTQLESRQIAFNLYQIPVNNLLEHIYEKYEVDVKNAGLNFAFENQALCESSVRVAVDPDRIEQVFANLIFNAIKHTPPGGSIAIGYEITADATQPSAIQGNLTTDVNIAKNIISEEQTRQNVLIKIKDTGSGIPQEDLPLIFERFYKGSKSRNSALGGSGLGLSIAKEIVEFHGGKIWAESKQGEGSTFCFTLPVCMSGKIPHYPARRI